MSEENKESDLANDSIQCEADNSNQAVDNEFASDVAKRNDKQKIDILLKPTANAPIMKKKKWAVDADKQLGWIIEFVKKYLKLEPQESLFVYVNQTFAPSPDQTVRNLYDCYNTEGKLVLHYCKGQAWG